MNNWVKLQDFAFSRTKPEHSKNINIKKIIKRVGKTLWMPLMKDSFTLLYTNQITNN